MYGASPPTGNGFGLPPRSPSASTMPSAPPPDDSTAVASPPSVYPSLASPSAQYSQSNMAPRSPSFSAPNAYAQPPPPPPPLQQQQYASMRQQPMGGAVGAPIAVQIGFNASSPPMQSGNMPQSPYAPRSPSQQQQQGYYQPGAMPVASSPVGQPPQRMAYGQQLQPPQGQPQQPPPMNSPSNTSHPSLRGGWGPVTPHVGPRPMPAMPAGLGPNGMPAATLSPSSVVELRFRCKNLKTSDVFSESDPFVVVYLEEATHMWREIGRTETVVNSANPTFTTAVEMDYFFEEVQRLRLEVFDRDSKSEKLAAHDFLGCVELTMAQLMSSTGQSMVLALLQSQAKYVAGLTGHIVISAEEVSMCADMVTVQFGADKVDNKDGWFSKSDPFLNIYRLKDELADPKVATSWIHVWRSVEIRDNLDPRWPRVTLGVRTLCNGNLARLLKFEVMDWEASGRHQFIGSCTMPAAEFVSGERTSVDLINPERQARKGKRYKNSGVLRVLSIECFKQNTFAEFLRGGCEISLMVGIDYTASNGAPSDPSSLHYTGSSYYGQMNEYQSAITATGAILEPYDHDRRFPVYGFGAIVNGTVSHCFPLTFDPAQPEVEGVSGILQAYANSFPYVQLHGPTNFAPLIRQAATIAQLFSQPSGAQPNLKYFVMLILTDGAIMDMDATVEEIVSASTLPLSIVIVGVGNADFSAMDKLDADGKLLRARSGRTAARDIVQFVPFNKFRGNPARLAKETLAEIPLQLTQHFRARGIKPNPPLQRAGTEMLIANATAAHKPRQSQV